MAAVTGPRAAASHPAGFFSRLLGRWLRLVRYLTLPGYHPASHAYHFRAREQAASLPRPPRRMHP